MGKGKGKHPKKKFVCPSMMKGIRCKNVAKCTRFTHPTICNDPEHGIDGHPGRRRPPCELWHLDPPKSQNSADLPKSKNSVRGKTQTSSLKPKGKPIGNTDGTTIPSLTKTDKPATAAAAATTETESLLAEMRTLKDQFLWAQTLARPPMLVPPTFAAAVAAPAPQPVATAAEAPSLLALDPAALKLLTTLLLQLVGKQA
jgi:hypothetical protein